MKKHTLLTLLVLLIGNTIAFGQSFELSGTVHSTEKTPIPFASVFLLKQADSTIVSGTSADENGSFLFNYKEKDTFLLYASYLENKSKYYTVLLTKDIDLGVVLIDNLVEELSEVTVTKNRPTLVRKIDRHIFNVENTALTSGSSWDILKRTPGVIVLQDEINIKNNPAVIYLNDRKVYLTSSELRQLLEGFSGQHVKSVEVITNPPAKYDSEGGAILNIITSKNLATGYKGSVNGSYAIAQKPKYNLGTSHFMKNDWVNSFISYNLTSKTDYKKDFNKIRFKAAGLNPNSDWHSIFEKYTYTNSHNLNSIFDFKINEKNDLNVSVSAVITPKKDSRRNEQTNIFGTSEVLDSLFNTSSTVNEEIGTLMFSTQHKLDMSEGGELNSQANFISFNSQQDQFINTQYYLPNNTLLNENEFNSLAKQQTSIFTLQTDYSKSLEKLSFETGLKYSGISSNSKQDFNTLNTESFIGVTSDDYDYDENIYSGYISVNKAWDKLQLKTGLRAEHTSSVGNSVVLNKKNNQNYTNIFPTFNLNYSANEDNAYSISYTKRITRPRFQTLNPFRTYINANYYTQGNPVIVPQIINKITLGYVLKNKLSFDLYYEHNAKTLVNLPYQNNTDHSFSVVTSNLKSSEQYSFDVTYQSYVADNWYLYAYSSFFALQNKFVAATNSAVKLNKNAYYVMAQNYFTMLKDQSLNVVLSGTYLSSFMTGSYIYEEPSANVSLSLQKYFLNKQLMVSLDFEDILNTSNIPLASIYNDQDNAFFAKPETRLVRLKLLYKFGNFKLKNNNSPLDIIENNRLNN